jgi:hypothetical protein
MLNPSTADAFKDDNTIKRVKSFTAAGGGGELFVANLYAWRATDPVNLFMMPEYQRIGPINDSVIAQFLTEARGTGGRVVVAWGAHPKAQGRAAEVVKVLRTTGPLHCLGKNKDGSPKHPLYVPGSQKLVPY